MIFFGFIFLIISLHFFLNIHLFILLFLLLNFWFRDYILWQRGYEQMLNRIFFALDKCTHLQIHEPLQTQTNSLKLLWTAHLYTGYPITYTHNMCLIIHTQPHTHTLEPIHTLTHSHLRNVLPAWNTLTNPIQPHWNTIH